MRKFIGLIKDHRSKVGRIKAVKRKVSRNGCKNKVKNS